MQTVIAAPSPFVPPPAVVPVRWRLLMAALAAVGVFVLLASALARVVTYDEDQYLAAGLFVSRGMLPYRDFVYLQAPLYPFLLGALFKLTGGYYLLAGRLLTFVLSVLCGALLWKLLQRLGAGLVLSCVLLAACLASPFLATPLANSRNDVLPLALFLGGLLVLPWHGEGRWGWRVLAALLMGLAVEAKVSFLFGPVVLLVHALFVPGRRLVPAVVGTALAAVPGLVLLAVSGWAPMAFGLFGYHVTAPAAWYAQQGLETQLEAPVRLQQLMDWLLLGGNLTLVVLSVALMLIAFARKRNWKRPGQLLVGLLVGALVMDFLPSPSWAMYFAPVAVLLACCIAHLDRITILLADPARKRVLFLVAALPVVPVLIAEGPELVQFVRGNWVGLASHQSALRVHAALGARTGTVVTLFPHLVMDANPVPVEFASGPFVFRSGALYPRAALEALHALSPDMLPAFMERERPAAIYAGSYASVFRTAMDEPLSAYAEAHGWQLVLTEADGGRLWVDPTPR